MITWFSCLKLQTNIKSFKESFIKQNDSNSYDQSTHYHTSNEMFENGGDMQSNVQSKLKKRKEVILTLFESVKLRNERMRIDIWRYLVDIWNQS